MSSPHNAALFAGRATGCSYSASKKNRRPVISFPAARSSTKITAALTSPWNKRPPTRVHACITDPTWEACQGKIGNKVIFTGIMDHEQLKKLIPCAEISVAPSIFP